jgi:hypothetical protein
MTPVLLMVLAAISGGEPMSDNMAVVEINHEGSCGDQPTAHRVTFAGASVAQGSYSGLSLHFEIEVNTRESRVLELFIPSHGELVFSYSSSRGEALAQVPDTPFTIDSSSTAEIIDRRGRPRPLKIAWTEVLRRAPDSRSENTLELPDCTLTVSAFEMDAGALSMVGRFECRSNESEKTVSGQLSLTDRPVGSSKVD